MKNNEVKSISKWAGVIVLLFALTLCYVVLSREPVSSITPESEMYLEYMDSVGRMFAALFGLFGLAGLLLCFGLWPDRHEQVAEEPVEEYLSYAESKERSARIMKFFSDASNEAENLRIDVR